MSGRSTAERSGGELPPGWTAADATTHSGHIHAAVWRAFPDVTQFELALAMGAGSGLDWLRDEAAENAVARVGALRGARRERSDLPEDAWQRLVQVVYPTLSEQQRQNPTELLTAIATFRPPPDDAAVAYAPLARRGPGRPAWTPALFWERWREAESKAAPSDRLADIATGFRSLDGTTGVESAHLRRLRRKFTTRTIIPE